MKLSNTMMINEKLLPTSKKAFTLAEVLITLSILGVVAALTIPTLVNRQSDLAAQTRISKAISAFEDFAAIYMAENSVGDLTGLTCANLSDYFKQVTTDQADACQFTTADGVSWRFGVANGNLTGYATAADAANNGARYAVGMWAGNNVVNGLGATDGVANGPAIANADALLLGNGSVLIQGRNVTPATLWLQGTRTCTANDIALTVNNNSFDATCTH